MKPCILQPHPVSSAAVEKGVPLEVKVRSQIQTVSKALEYLMRICIMSLKQEHEIPHQSAA